MIAYCTEPSKHMHEDATKLQQYLDLLHECILCASQELYHQLSLTKLNGNNLVNILTLVLH